jgi:hypothetical protein
VQLSCAQGVNFNPDTLQCDLPQNVRCRLTRIVIPQTPLLPDCSSEDEFFPNLINCKQYYQCINHIPKLMDCPVNQLWNNQKLACEKSESTMCARRFDGMKQIYIYGTPNDTELKKI